MLTFPGFSASSAANSTGTAGIENDHLGLPTPSPEYTAGDLLGHVDEFSVGPRLPASKTPPPRDELIDLFGLDPA